ncbi:MAG TPA: hypothetical protein VMG08_16615 [Allosphingosinicella sp.]|nr:hypothetical protein [Allosphingosinicella sp.]
MSLAGQDRLYNVATTFLMRRAGIRGREAFMEVATYDEPRVTIKGLKGGRFEFPVAEIERLRAGVEYWKQTFYRCELRHNGRNYAFMILYPLPDYSDAVLHLAAEMQTLGRFDRVQRGLRWWEHLGHLLFWGGFGLLLAYGLWDISHFIATRPVGEQLLAGGLFLFTIYFVLDALWRWWRWYRPRRARDLDDLAEVLP